MNKELVVLTAAFALAAGVVFAQEMKKADNVAAPAVAAAPAKAVQDMNAEGTNAQAANTENMNAEATNTENMNAEATNTENMNAETTNTEDVNAQAPVKVAPAKADPAAAPAAQPKY
jgi:hypothetical protein